MSKPAFHRSLPAMRRLWPAPIEHSVALAVSEPGLRTGTAGWNRSIRRRGIACSRTGRPINEHASGCTRVVAAAVSSRSAHDVRKGERVRILVIEDEARIAEDIAKARCGRLHRGGLFAGRRGRMVSAARANPSMPLCSTSACRCSTALRS